MNFTNNCRYAAFCHWQSESGDNYYKVVWTLDPLSDDEARYISDHTEETFGDDTGHVDLIHVEIRHFTEPPQFDPAEWRERWGTT